MDGIAQGESPRSEKRIGTLASKAAVPNLFGTKDRFRGRQFFQGWPRGDGSGGNASDGEQQMKLRSPATHLLLLS